MSYSFTRYSIARAASVAVVGCTAAFAGAQSAAGPLVPLGQMSPPSVIAQALPVGHANPNQTIHLSIALPSRDAVGFQAMADAVSNPSSPQYGKFLTPQQVGDRFGASTTDVNNLVAYLQANGFTIKLVSPNHMAILADATVAQAETAFGTELNNYHLLTPSKAGRTDFYSFSGDVKAPRSIAPSILTIQGLENFEIGHPTLHKGKQANSPITVLQNHVLYNTAPMYNSGYQGKGRTIAISNWDGYSLANVPLLYSTYGLPTPSGGVGSNITVVQTNGGGGVNGVQGEADLDIQMELGNAPLAKLIIYDDGAYDLLGVLTEEASQNKADIISESWEWILPSDSAYMAVHQQHLAMTLQGITYMSAAGDTGTTYRDIYPHVDPEVMSIGGTIATVSNSGARQSEVAWSGGGGGWNTLAEAFNILPPWQKGTTVPTNIPYRLIPDISFNAAGPNGAYAFYLQGSLTGGYDGTSFASPVCAGCLAIVENKLALTGALPPVNGVQRLGRLQDYIYKQNGRSDVYFDITSGSNGRLPDGSTSNAKAGWDFTTGWGAVDFNAFEKTFPISVGSYITPISVGIYGGQGRSASGNAASLAAVDGNYYTLQSVPVTNLGQAAAVTMTFQLTNIGSISAVSIKLVGLSTAQTTSFVYLQNQSTGQYDLVNTSSYSPTLSTVTIPINSISRYINGSGQMIVLARVVSPLRQNTAAFNASFDAAQLTEVTTGN